MEGWCSRIAPFFFQFHQFQFQFHQFQFQFHQFQFQFHAAHLPELVPPATNRSS